MSDETVELFVSELQAKFGGKEALNGRLLRFTIDNNLPGVRLALAAGANPNSTIRDLTPAIEAALYGHTQVLELLHKAGADLDPKDVGSNTPWYFANCREKTQAVDFLRKNMDVKYPVLTVNADQKIVVNSADLTAVFGDTAAKMGGAPDHTTVKRAPVHKFG